MTRTDQVPNFDENGFLKGRIETWVAEQRRENSGAFASSERLNVECHQFLDSRAVNLSEERTRVAVILLARMMELYQATIVLVERGMSAATRALFRTHLEAYFTLVALLDDPTFCDDYLDQFHTHQKTLLNRIQNSNAEGLEDLQTDLDSNRIDEINALVRDREIKRLSTQDVAKRADMEGVYATAYAQLSGAVHTSAYDIESHLDFDEANEEIVGFKYGPSSSETRQTLGLMGMSMADSLERVSREFGEDRTTFCAEMKEAFRRHLGGVANTPE